MPHSRVRIGSRLESHPTAGQKAEIKRPLPLFALLALIGTWLAPGAAGADEALHRVLLEQLEAAVAGDDRPDLRSFVLQPFASVFDVDPLTEDAGSFEPSPFVLQQLQPEAANLPPGQPVRVVMLEDCGPLLEPYGLAEREDLGFDYGDIDRIRLSLAFDASGLAADFSLEDVEALRSSSLTGALRALNTRLFKLHAEGRTDALHMVLDVSDGCGSEPFTLMAIRPPKNLSAINIIPDFYFTVCEKRHADPWDVSLCPWWNAAPEQLMGNGLYHWQGRLRSGGTRTGSIRIDREWHSWEREVILLR